MVEGDYKELANLLLQRQMNEKAFEANVISKNMYEYAKKILNNEIDLLEKICYN